MYNNLEDTRAHVVAMHALYLCSINRSMQIVNTSADRLANDGR